ncbi:MAG: glycosyltransferase family A protein [Cyanobacteria bacterium J06614_10]
MTTEPLVSVVIPAYNAADYLPETIQSVIDQSYENWELLVVDDGSTDATPTLVQRFHEADRRVRHVPKANGGVSSARNLGAQEAKGTLLAFLDADDRWLKDKLSAHVNHMSAHPEIGVSFARVELIKSDGQTTHKLTNNVVSRLQPQDLFYSNPTVTTSNLVIRRDIFLSVGGFDEAMQYNEDVELLFRVAFHSDQTGGLALAGIDDVLVQYRLHDSGLSSTLSKMEAGWLTLMEKARTIAPSLVEAHYNAAYGHQLQYLARQTLRLNLSARVGAGFMNRALAKSWPGLYREPKRVAIALLIYFKLITFDLFKISV